MNMTRIWDHEWTDWIKESVENRTLLCMAACGDKATRIRYRGKLTGAFCRACYGELYYGNIPKLDRPKGLKRPRRRR